MLRAKPVLRSSKDTRKHLLERNEQPTPYAHTGHRAANERAAAGWPTPKTRVGIGPVFLILPSTRFLSHRLIISPSLYPVIALPDLSPKKRTDRDIRSRDFNTPSSRIHKTATGQQTAKDPLLPSLLPRVKVRQFIEQVYAKYTKESHVNCEGLAYLSLSLSTPSEGKMSHWAGMRRTYQRATKKMLI